MARKITDECIACGSCEAECPNEAIRAGDPIYIIDPQKCDECADKEEVHCKAVCPVSDEAIVMA